MCDKNDDICVLNFERAEGVKMLKWIKVRQNASTTTTTSATIRPSPRQEIRNDGAGVKIGDKIEEEGEDSGMEKEDSVCNVELSDLKKVRLFDPFISLESLLRLVLLTATSANESNYNE